MSAAAKMSSILVDVAIVGAGVAGLWLANLLTRRGFAVAVCDPGPLGGAQTIMSQGIVHGGVKYALGGARRSRWLAAMPARWRACLAGQDDVDLRGVEIAADAVRLAGVRARAKPRTLLAGRLAGGVAKRLAPTPPPFGRGAVYATADFALDVPSLVRRLAAPVRHRVLARRVDAGALTPGPQGVAGLRLAGRAVEASAYVFAAGAGNAALAERVGVEAPMRLRPLRQLCVWPRAPFPPVCAHCLAGAFGVEPELTVTTHGPALYVGGEVASAGAGGGPRDDAERIERARALLSEHLPGVDFAGATFKVVAAQRAEPAAAPLGDAFVARRGNAFVCWPIKLSLAPRLGDRLLAALAGLRPRSAPWPGDLATRPYATPPYAC